MDGVTVYRNPRLSIRPTTNSHTIMGEGDLNIFSP